MRLQPDNKNGGCCSPDHTHLDQVMIATRVYRNQDYCKARSSQKKDHCIQRHSETSQRTGNISNLSPVLKKDKMTWVCIQWQKRCGQIDQFWSWSVLKIQKRITGLCTRLFPLERYGTGRVSTGTVPLPQGVYSVLQKCVVPLGTFQSAPLS